jgi:hypothetical protein
MGYEEQSAVMPNLLEKAKEIEAENYRCIDYSIKNILFRISKKTGISLDKETWVATQPVIDELLHTQKKSFADGIKFANNVRIRDYEKILEDALIRLNIKL